MESLPLIPGYAVRDPTVRDFRVAQKLKICNGFQVVRDSDFGIGGDSLDARSSAFPSDHETPEYDPTLSYGRRRNYDGLRRFVPHYVLFAQKRLSFKGYFCQSEANEKYRVRRVNMFYFLEDDTILVTEPVVRNAGFLQGKLVRRGKIAKDKTNDIFYSWKDLNVGIDIAIHGIIFRTIDCDSFTREFLTSQGIEVNEKEEAPEDPNEETANRIRVPAKSVKDSRRAFLEYDGMVLSFEASWRDNFYSISFYLTDDTIAVREFPSTLLLRRTKVPKNVMVPSDMNFNAGEIEYLSPVDFTLGERISIFGRDFCLFNCDEFTRKFYSDAMGVVQPPGRALPMRDRSPKKLAFKPPPHIGFGSPEDTLASCLSVVPKPPRKDVVRQIQNFPHNLRYAMEMDVVHPEDKGREFILKYNLNEGTTSVTEVEVANSGRRGGSFLSATRVPKPGTDPDDPKYYTPEDFFIGAKINIFNHHFIIKDADFFVYRYMEEYHGKFPEELRNNLRDHFAKRGEKLSDVTNDHESTRN